MIRAGLVVLAAAVVLGAGCNPAPPRQVKADEARLAADALAAGDHVKAAQHYRRALAEAPDSLPLHYGLAIALSHLDARAEAIVEFRWVLQHGPAGTPEVDNAREWLAKVGALARPRGRAPGEFASNGRSDYSSIEGRVVSAAGPPDPLSRQQIFLIEQPSRVHHYRLRTDEDGRYRFTGVAPGVYKLSDRISGRPTWRLRVEVQPGQALFVDLGAGNSTRLRDDFPSHE